MTAEHDINPNEDTMNTDQASADTTSSDIVARNAGGDGALTARDAANSLVDARRKDQAQQQEHDGGAPHDDAPAESTESPAQAEDTARDNGPGETTPADDREADAPPPIEPPRSWTKEDKELFKGLPRETQERLATRERSREADFLKRQNEAAEKSRALSATAQAAERMRAHYEGALPMLVQALQEQQAGEFADIKSIADVEKMAREDWPRYALWDAQQKRIATVVREAQAAQARQAVERTTRWSTFAAEQDALFAEKAPELAEPDAKHKAAQSAAAMLKGLGFSDAELGAMWAGQGEVSLRDHRVQLLLRDAVRYRGAQAAAKSAQHKPVPHVQRPGPAPARNADADGRVKDLTERLNRTGTLRDAAALLAAQRAARR
jgi:hypothetical protein